MQRIEVVPVSADAAFDPDLSRRADVLVYHEHGRLPPLTLVCAWSTDVSHVHHLAALLDPEQPIYAITPPEFGSKAEYPETIAAWADFMETRLPAVPADGAYRIGGYSLAGLIALELAERCADAGHRIPLVLLIDVWVPRQLGRERRRPVRETPKRLARLADRLTRYVEIPTRRERRAFLWHAWSPTHRAARRAEREERRHLRAVEMKNRWSEEPVPEDQAMRNAAGREISFLRRAVQVAYLKYEAHPTHLPLGLIRTRESVARAGDDATMGWAHRIRGPFHSAVAPGSHFSLFEPKHVPGVAAAVDAMLHWGRTT